MRRVASPEESALPRQPKSFEAFGGFLRKRREELGLTLDVMAGLTGISKPYLSNIETARAPGPPSEEKVRALAKALQWDGETVAAAADWLRTPLSVRKALGRVSEGRDSRPRRSDGSVDLDALTGKAAVHRGRGERVLGEELPLRAVPVINRVTAGKAGEFTDMDYPTGVADEYVPMADLSGMPVRGVFALRITGESMMPTYREGEVIIVGPGAAKEGDDCVVRLGEAENYATTFKRVGFVMGADGEAERVRLIPLNPAFAERVVGAEELTGIYPLMYRLIPAGVRVEGEREAATGKGEGSMTERVSIEHD